MLPVIVAFWPNDEWKPKDYAPVIKSSSLILGSSPELQNVDGDDDNEKAEEDGGSGDGNGEMVMVMMIVMMMIMVA